MPDITVMCRTNNNIWRRMEQETKIVTLTIKLEVDESVDVEEMVNEMDYSFDYDGILGSTITEYV
jgi:hypothetical protein